MKSRKQQNFTLYVTDGVNILDEVVQKGYAFRDAANKAFTKRYSGYDRNNLSINKDGRTLYVVGPEFLNVNLVNEAG